MPSLRLLPFAPADGPTNMAADEAMLESAADRGVASLRFYTWDAPTLSLGYFHPTAVRFEVPHLDLMLLSWVRRSTGGAAIVHHRELTYALALPAGTPWHGADSWVCRFHYLLRSVLADHGVVAHMVVCGEEKKLGEVLCFLHQTPGDLLLYGSKVAGSAQRKLKGALLQHGSLLLHRSEHAPELPGMCDLAGRELFTPERLAALLTERFAAETGWGVEPGDWTAAECDRVPLISAEKYANLDWSTKR